VPIRVLVIALVAAACGGGRAPAGVGTDEGPTHAVQEFMQAVADSNLSRMAEWWGSASGPASVTRQPEDYQRRVQIMHAYLKGNSARAITRLDQDGNTVTLLVELVRADCARRVPFTVVRTGAGGWVVNAIELAQVGTPGRPCSSEQRIP